jgi:lycopene beta-cyclase
VSTAGHGADLVVVGAGPAGRSTAHHAARRGLAVVLVDPAPHRRWGATYGAFREELADDVPLAAEAAAPVVRTATGGTQPVGVGRYAVLDTAALQDGLDLAGVRVLAQRATEVHADGVRTADGTHVRARVVLDARGATPAGRTVQTALGVVVDAARAAPLLDGADGVFMDWRRAGWDARDEPTFCYVVPVGGGRVLLEETSLAAHPAPPAALLRRRLHDRLDRHGVALTGDEPTEHVRFALDTPLPRAEWLGRAPGVVRLGAAAPLVHPATGYSVAGSLALAPRVAAAVAGGAGTADVHRLVWPAAARATHLLRLRGLRALLGFDAGQTDRFFAAFFALEPDRQRAYLGSRTDAPGTATAMAALLPHLDADLRGRLVSGAVLGRG